MSLSSSDANLDIFAAEATVARLADKIRHLQERLGEISLLQHVGEIRQRGFMVGIELVADRESREEYPAAAKIGHKVILAARNRGLIIRPLGNVIVLMPPLAITREELDRLCDITLASIREVTEY